MNIRSLILCSLSKWAFAHCRLSTCRPLNNFVHFIIHYDLTNYRNIIFHWFLWLKNYHFKSKRFSSIRNFFDKKFFLYVRLIATLLWNLVLVFRLLNHQIYCLCEWKWFAVHHSCFMLSDEKTDVKHNNNLISNTRNVMDFMHKSFISVKTGN